jgi:two-component system, LuxR family, response regulator FixJ
MNDLIDLVYIIEPDFAVRNSLRFALEAEGFVVQEMPDATSFLSKSNYPSRSCLVVADELADMSGVDLIQGLRERSLEIPAVLVASLPDQILIKRVEKMGVPLIEKPILDETLINVIRGMIR